MKIDKQYTFNRNQCKPSFRAGMTNKIANEIQNADVFKISNNLAKKGIDSEFQGNKVIAWCSNKVVEIFENINQIFNENIALPKGIYVENFQDLNIKSPSKTSGFCNFFPTHIYKDSNKVTKGNVVMFNTFQNEAKADPNNLRFNWQNINELSDMEYSVGQSATPHFLNTFIHEFAHAAHENNILDKMGGNSLLKLFEKSLSEKNLQKFNNKNGQLIVDEICDYAAKSPFEAIACDIPKKISGSLNENLDLISNPFENTVYSIQKSENFKKNSMDKLIEKIWNGKF